MRLTIVYGTEHEVAKLTKPVINELVSELNLKTYPAIIKLATLNADELLRMIKALDEDEADHALVFVSDMNINPASMLRLYRQFPSIESFRSARAPFRMASFVEPGEQAKQRVLH